MVSVKLDKAYYFVNEIATANIMGLPYFRIIKYIVVNQQGKEVYSITWFNTHISDDKHKFTITKDMIGTNKFIVQINFQTATYAVFNVIEPSQTILPAAALGALALLFKKIRKE